MKSIAAQFEKIRKQSIEAAEKVYRETMFEIGTSTIFYTPKDTGILVGGWLSGYAFDNTQHNTAGAQESTNRLTQAVNGLSVDQSFYFINPLPYAYKIEYEGHSSENAPDGMLRKSLLKFDDIAQEKINKYKI